MLKKSLLVPVLTLCLGGAIMAQAPNRDCGTMEVDARLRADDAGYSLNREAIEQFTQNYIATHAGAGERTVVTIPVVVHVVYNTAAENIADSYVYSQIDVLNEDFRRLNADAALTPAAFAGVAADCEVEFCLANTDPSGNPTTGITRTSTTKTSFNTSDQMKYDTYGHAAWDRNSYLNLWVCDLSSGLLGYAQFPGGPAATDGVVIDYKYFGVGGAGAAPYDLGRTATHEVGHWLNLYHIWGDDGTGCGGSDLVADTPNQADETYGCPLPTIRISCSNGPNGDMYVNYMDYTDDACMNMFTAGQKSRMQALFSPGGSRYSILSSMGCSGGGGATCDTPSGLSTSGITTSTATFNWSSVGAAASYNVRYRTTGGGSWINVSTGSTSYNATGLASATEYEWQVQSNCGGGDVSAYSASTVFTTSGGGGGCSDVYEANETIGNAAIVSTNVTLHGLISTTTDVDWYKFTTSNPNTKINVTLTSLPADYDMRLYNQNGKQKGVSQNGGTTDEQLIWNTSKAGNRYIKVYGWSGAHDASDCYDLLISVQSANWRTDGLMLEQVWDNSVVGIYPNPATGANVTIDYFSVQEDMNVQVAVYDILGNRVQSFNQAVEGGENMIDMDVTQMNAGVYLVVISNGKSNYTGRFIVN